jgi:hypothetical protein
MKAVFGEKFVARRRACRFQRPQRVAHPLPDRIRTCGRPSIGMTRAWWMVSMRRRRGSATVIRYAAYAAWKRGTPNVRHRSPRPRSRTVGRMGTLLGQRRAPASRCRLGGTAIRRVDDERGRLSMSRLGSQAASAVSVSCEADCCFPRGYR